MTHDRVLLVRVGSERFALPLADVLEVVDAPTIEEVPLLPSGVSGQSVQRGRLMPVLDFGPLVGVSRAGGEGVLLVLAAESERVGLLVDDVVDVASAPASAVRPVPATGSASVAMLRGVLALEGGLAGLVDADVLRATVLARLAMEVG